jgi:hypothetical protein
MRIPARFVAQHGLKRPIMATCVGVGRIAIGCRHRYETSAGAAAVTAGCRYRPKRRPRSGYDPE